MIPHIKLEPDVWFKYLINNFRIILNMSTTPQEQEAKKLKKAQVLVDLDVVETSFEKWAKPGHFSRTLAKGPKTTTWIWNLHADAHDFDMQTKSLEDVSRKFLVHISGNFQLFSFG